MEDARLSKKLHGFHRHFKGRFLLLSNGVLSQNEYLLWDLGFSVLAGWDKNNHPENYGVIKLTQSEIGQYLRWDKSTVCKTIQSLIAKEFWTNTGRSEYKVNGFNIHEYFSGLASQNKLINLQQFIESKQHLVASPQQTVSTEQYNAAKTNFPFDVQNVAIRQHSSPHTLVSSKDNLVSPLRSDEEYEQLAKEFNTTPQNIRDMDESVAESTPINHKDDIPELDF